MLCLFMVTFQFRGFFISESTQLLFQCSGFLHNLTMAPASFAVGITEKTLGETQTCRNQVVLQQLGAICFINTSVSFLTANQLQFFLYC